METTGQQFERSDRPDGDRTGATRAAEERLEGPETDRNIRTVAGAAEAAGGLDKAGETDTKPG